MDYKYIEQLLERYWNCETTLEEEEILRMFFSQKDVPVSLLAYKDLFTYGAASKKNDILDDSFDKRMLELVNEPLTVNARTISIRQRLMPLFKAAAVIAIFLTLGNASQVAFTDHNQPDMAADVMKVKEGASVAMGDSVKPAKADTTKRVPDVGIVAK